MHRRGGKDRTALAQACRDASGAWACTLRPADLEAGQEGGVGQHHRRRQNLIKQTLPDSIIKKKVEDEMKPGAGQRLDRADRRATTSPACWAPTQHT
jgi:hypothetical protein